MNVTAAEEDEDDYHLPSEDDSDDNDDAAPAGDDLAVGICDGFTEADVAKGGIDWADAYKHKRESSFPLSRILNASEFNCKLAQAARVEDGVHIRNAITGQIPLDMEPLADHPNYNHLNNILRGRFVVPGLSRLLKASLKITAEIDIQKYFDILKVSEMEIVHADLAGQTSSAIILKLINSLPVEHLRNLTMWNMKIDDVKSAMSLFSNNAMRNMSRLKFLDLCYNRMGDDGVAHLAQGFQYVPSIEILSLSWNDIGYEGTVHLAAGVKHLSAMTTMYYDGNDFGDKEFECLFEVLKSMPSATQLIMSSNKITDISVTYLVENVLPSMPALTMLVLSDNKIEDEGRQTIEEAREMYSAVIYV